MKHETKFADWIRRGGHGDFTMSINETFASEKKFSVVPDRLLASILDDALRLAVGRINNFLPENSSINISTLNTSELEQALAGSVAQRISQTGVPVTPDDPVIEAAIRRYAERLNGHFQRSGLGVTDYIWRSSDDDRVRPLHREYDDKRFSWDHAPEGGHPGEGFNCRCFAEPVMGSIAFADGATCDIINETMLNDIFPTAPDGRLRAIAREIDLQVVSGKLNSPERLAHFFGQVKQEVGPKARLVENLDYLATRLQIFSYFRRNPVEAQHYGRTADHPADQEAIANRAYANRNGNGDIASGDGWRYRGRGLKQLTGRANYSAFTDRHRELFGEDVDFEANPERLSEPKYAVRSAIFFWVKNDLYAIADRGVSQTAANAITRIINRHTNSYQERWENTRDVHRSGLFSNICRFSVTAPRFEDR